MSRTLTVPISTVWQQINQVFFILTRRELSVNRKDLQAPTLAGPTQLYQRSGPPSCTTPRQQTIYVLHLDNRLYKSWIPVWNKNYVVYNEVVFDEVVYDEVVYDEVVSDEVVYDKDVARLIIRLRSWYGACFQTTL